MGAWYVVDRTYDMNSIGFTWVFKIKCFPDILINKFKAGFFNFGINSWKMFISSKHMTRLCNGVTFFNANFRCFIGV